MPALTFEGQLVNLSYTYDALTVYPKFELFQNISYPQDVLREVQEQCNKLPFVHIPDGMEPTIKYKRGIDCLKNVKFCMDYDRNIMMLDDDHNFYHQDNFNRNQPHFHIKFHSMLDRQQMHTLLSVMMGYELFMQDEKTAFMQVYEARYANSRTALDPLLTKQKYADLKAIVNFIKDCSENDILVDLHQYLLSDKFDYLRQLTGLIKISFWQGTDRNHQVTKTSHSWAMIEKALTLKMSNNILENCSQFTSELAEEHANQLSQSHPFFAIKRNTLSRFRVTSSTYDAFCKRDEAKLVEKYRQFFK